MLAIESRGRLIPSSLTWHGSFLLKRALGRLESMGCETEPYLDWLIQVESRKRYPNHGPGAGASIRIVGALHITVGVLHDTGSSLASAQFGAMNRIAVRVQQFLIKREYCGHRSACNKGGAQVVVLRLIYALLNLERRAFQVNQPGRPDQRWGRGVRVDL